jgi:hypothetical protein
MTGQYLIGELSVRLEQLQATTGRAAAADVAGLRTEVETGPLTGLAWAAARAMAMADKRAGTRCHAATPPRSPIRPRSQLSCANSVSASGCWGDR